MTARAALLVALAFAAVPATVQAQSWPPRPGVAVDPNRYQADQHRYEMDRLRAQAEQRQALVRQIELETRLNRQAIEAARQPEPVLAPSPRALRSPEEERAARQAATERRRATEAGVSQIDAWLDRSRD